ncbi:hypothetical protein PENSPDRAFT_759669 [Peniophora sp. CONT]|nr:hypothetical protein PENSPDRAFT_759669 [Peniophora sp. CONT]
MSHTDMSILTSSLLNSDPLLSVTTQCNATEIEGTGGGGTNYVGTMRVFARYVSTSSSRRGTGENIPCDHPSVLRHAPYLDASRTGADDLNAEALTKQQHDVTGMWNVTEAITPLFRLPQAINVLPDIDDVRTLCPSCTMQILTVVCEVPVLPAHRTVAAHDISEIVCTGDCVQTAALYHVVNPNMTTHWGEMNNFFRACGLVFDIVDRRAYVERLARTKHSRREPYF